MSPPRPHSTRVVAAALLLAIPGAAEGSKLSWGVRAGMSAARFHGSHGSWVGPDYRGGLHAGLYGALRLGAGFSLQPEIAWVSKGSTGDPRIVNPPPWLQFHVEYRVNYLEIPLLLRLDLPAGGSVEPYVVAGPAPAIRIGKGRVELGGFIVGEPPSPRPARGGAQIFEEFGTLNSNDFDEFDLGLVGGLGVRLGRGRVRLGLEGRYTHGLLDVTPWATDTRNAAFAVTAAIEVR